MDHRDLVLVKNKLNEIHLEGALKCRKSFSTKDGRERTIEFLLGNFHNVDLPHKVPVRKKKAGLAYP